LARIDYDCREEEKTLKKTICAQIMYMLMSFINLLFDLKVTQFSTITFNEHLMIYSYSLEKKSEYMCVLICGK